MGAVPSPRYEYYQNTDFSKTKSSVLGHFSDVIEKLGTYYLYGSYGLLQTMQITSYATLMIGLIFDIMLILFVTISVLLIYSLLMINIETKTFEIGVMRMTGLSKGGFIAMIAI